MKKFKIGDLWVQFPFIPYPPQETFMEKMVESLDSVSTHTEHTFPMPIHICLSLLFLAFLFVVETQCFARITHWNWQDSVSFGCRTGMARFSKKGTRA